MPVLEHISDIVQIKDLRRRVIITVALICAARIGTYIPLPNTLIPDFDADSAAGTVFGMIDMFAGGALENMAIFGLGVMPYISASIIFQLLGSVVPAFEKLKKEGEAGRKKLNQYTRIATVFICFFQGIVVVRGLYGFGVVPEHIAESLLHSVWFSVSNGMLLMAGTMFLMWLGEQIDEHGIGNGISMLIMISIIARLPSQINLLAQNIRVEDSQQGALLKIIVLAALFVAIVMFIVYITKGERRIPVQQARHVRGPKVYGGQRHYLPLRVNQAGVMPLIFASALLQFPAIVAASATEALSADGGVESLWYRFFSFISSAVSPMELSLTYIVIYGLMIFFFSYFWTAIMFNPQEMSDNLKEYGSFIPGIRPGKRTTNYLEGIMNRVTLAGSAFLLGVALLPMLIAELLNIPLGAVTIYGGTSMLIVVGVALDLMSQINQHLEMRRYSGFAAGATGRRGRGRR